MSADKLRVNGQNITCYFREEDLRDLPSAVGRLTKAAHVEGFGANYIALRDLSHDPGEGNESRQFSPAVSAEELLKACEGKSYDRLYLSGRVKESPVGIGIDLKNYEIMVTVPRSHRELIGSVSALVTNPIETNL